MNKMVLAILASVLMLAGCAGQTPMGQTPGGEVAIAKAPSHHDYKGEAQ